MLNYAAYFHWCNKTLETGNQTILFTVCSFVPLNIEAISEQQTISCYADLCLQKLFYN